MLRRYMVISNAGVPILYDFEERSITKSYLYRILSVDNRIVNFRVLFTPREVPDFDTSRIDFMQEYTMLIHMNILVFHNHKCRRVNCFDHSPPVAPNASSSSSSTSASN